MEWTLKQIKFIAQSAEFYIGGGIPIKEKSYSKNTKYQNGNAEETYEDTVEYVDNYFYNINEKSNYYESAINTYIDEEMYDKDGYIEENENCMNENYLNEILNKGIIYESYESNHDKEI